MQQFFVILTAMVNVGMTVPYLFISLAFPKFKKLQGVDRSFEVFKTTRSANIWAAVVSLVLIFANGAAIIQPALTGDIATTFWSFIGPVIFGFAGWAIYTRYEIKCKKGEIINSETESE
jgi:amino acid transporter